MGAGFQPKGVYGGKDQDPDKPKKQKKKKAQVKKFPAKLKSEVILRFEDDFDAIYEAYTNPRKKDKLTLTQRRQLARWKFARQWISDFEPHSDVQVVEALRSEFGVSPRQAYTDVANCKRLFASVSKVNQEFEKVMYIERLLRLRRKSMELGTAKGFDVASRCDVTLAKIQGYDRAEHELPQPIIVEVNVTTDLSVLGLKPVENKQALIKSFWKKKDEEKQREIQEVDFDEILNNPRNESEYAR